jgi:hypothetical protein
MVVKRCAMRSEKPTGLNPDVLASQAFLDGAPGLLPITSDGAIGIKRIFEADA